MDGPLVSNEVEVDFQIQIEILDQIIMLFEILQLKHIIQLIKSSKHSGHVLLLSKASIFYVAN